MKKNCMHTLFLFWMALPSIFIIGPNHATTARIPLTIATFVEWKPTAAQLKKLGRETRIENYALRLPLGYSPVSMPAKFLRRRNYASHEIRVYDYTWRQRPDGTGALIGVHIISATLVSYLLESAGEQSDTRLLSERCIDGGVSSMRKVYPKAIFSSKAYGNVNGLPFVSEYIGYDVRLGKKKYHLQSFRYVDITQSSGIEITFHDNEPFSKQSLPIAELAVRTLHKIK